MQQESIYNLIPKEYVPPPKDQKYISKYPPTLPPTGSTLCHKTTSKPGVFNLAGEFAIHTGAHNHVGDTSTFGLPKGKVKPSSAEFIRKGTGTMGSNRLPDIGSISQFRYEGQRREPVPKKDEKPIMGLKSNKNFIVANAVENILAPAKVLKEETNWRNKSDFGKVPNYLQEIKSNIQNEYKLIQDLHQNEQEERDRQRHLLAPEEIQKLRDGLKRKWEAVNKEYQSITHISKMDTVGLKRKKEDCEKELAQLEKDMQKLNKPYIFVDALM